MDKKLYFCRACRQVHYDEDYRESDGDLEILKLKEFLRGVEAIKSYNFDGLGVKHD